MNETVEVTGVLLLIFAPHLPPNPRHSLQPLGNGCRHGRGGFSRVVLLLL